jgi:hypothetical protein
MRTGRLFFKRFISVAISMAFLSIAFRSGTFAQSFTDDAGVDPLLFIPGPGDSVHALVHPAGVVKWYDMFANIPSDWARISTMTFRLNSLPALAGLSLLTCALVASDKDTWGMTRRAYEQSGLVHSVNDVFVKVGDGAYHLGLAAGFAVYGFAADDRRALRTASQATEAILACGVAVQILKHISGRESPLAATSESGAWHVFPSPREYHSNQSRYYAFPSGHIATGMATITVLIENYPEAAWLRPVGYATVGLIGISLVARNYHWYSDLPLGIALGHSFGKLAAHPDGAMQDGSGGMSGLSISPVMTSFGGGVAVTLAF